MAWDVPASLRTRAGLRRRAEKGVAAFDIRTSSVETPVSMLSGGNQQRVVVARELSEQPLLVVACYATRGLDVRSAAQVKQWTRDLARQGVGVLFLSSDLEEVFEISDRIAVIFHGRIMRVLDRDETTISEVGQYMVGGGEVVSAPAE
jgi:simple sugar transport system ATP-binding protein